MQCVAGTRVKAGAPAYVWFTWAAFNAWLSTKLGRLGSILWAFFGDFPLDVPTFCATEPTIRSAPTTAQWLSAFTLDYTARFYVEGYLRECFAAFLWPTVCECIPTGSPYSCTTWKSHPDNTGWSGGAAHDYSFGVQFFPSANVTCYGAWLKVETVGTGLCQFGVWESGGANLQYVEAVTPTTSDAKYFFATPQLLLAGHQYFIFYQFPGASWSQSQKNFNSTPLTNSYGTFGECVIRSPISASWTVHANATDSPDPLFCPPPDTFIPPPPTDPVAIPDRSDPTCTTVADLCTRVAALQSSILETKTELNWLQSATAPTCWVPLTAHVGLTGAGTFAVVDVVGVYISVTVPARWGRTSETPARMIPKLGEVHPLVDSVMVDEWQLHYSDEQFLKVPTAVNGVAYSLKPGVTATITPLGRCK